MFLIVSTSIINPDENTHTSNTEGLRNMAFKETVHINGSVETVFAIATDFEYAPKFMENVVKSEKITEGPLQVGSQIKELRNVRGQGVETILTVTEFIPNEKYAVTSESGGMTVEYQYHFQAEGDETVVDFTGAVHSKKLKNILIRPFFERVLKKEDKNHLIRLRNYIENPKAD